MSIATLTEYASYAILAVGLAILPQTAKADVWNQKTKLTFSGPVEIPGQVLPAGTYIFKLVDSASDRNIVEVLNEREDHVYGIFLAIPDYHLKPADKPIITFEERAANAPEAIKAWFYPGENYGHDFVYPKVKAMQLAKANNQPVPSMPEEQAANTTKGATNMNEPHVLALKKAPLKAEKPTQEEVEVAEAFTPPPARVTPQPSAQPPASKMPENLPATGSPVPLIGLLGLFSLALAARLRVTANNMK